MASGERDESSGATAEAGQFEGGFDLAAGLAPEGVGEDAHGPARGADVLNFAAGNPVVDGATANANELTGRGN
jgi:hypothetical protein